MNYQKLFDYMSKEHGVDLLETDIQEIVRIVEEMKEAEEELEPCDHYYPIVKGKICACEFCGEHKPIPTN